MTAPTTARWQHLVERSRRPACGIASQLLNAGTNVVTAYAASWLLTPADFGRFVLAFAVVTLALAAGRGLIGSTMMVQLPAEDEAGRDALVRSALGFTLLVGLGATVLVAVAGLVQPVLWWFAPWVAVALLHDVGRYVFLARGLTGRALTLDVVWAVAQTVTLVAGALLMGSVTVPLLPTAWGLGALAGLLAFGVLQTARPTHPGRWTRATRDVAGWFTATSLVGQVEVYVVLLLTGLLLSSADVGGVRTVQLLAYQPALVVLGALLTLAQPEVVRARHSTPELVAAWRRISLFVLPVVVGLGIVALLRAPLMELIFPQYVGFAALVVPIALQSVFVAFSIAPMGVLNGLRRGRVAFALQGLRTLELVVATPIGIHLGGTTGMAWALAVASGVAWCQIRVVARRAVLRGEASEVPPRDDGTSAGNPCPPQETPIAGGDR